MLLELTLIICMFSPPLKRIIPTKYKQNKKGKEHMRQRLSPMTVTEASDFLRDVIYIPPHQIRLLARIGKCPFCMAVKNLSGHYTYYVHVNKLKQFKAGEIGFDD